MQAYDVLDGLSFVVLLPASLIELVVASKPVEDCLVAVSSALEKRVLAITVLA